MGLLSRFNLPARENAMRGIVLHSLILFLYDQADKLGDSLGIYVGDACHRLHEENARSISLVSDGVEAFTAINRSRNVTEWFIRQLETECAIHPTVHELRAYLLKIERGVRGALQSDFLQGYLPHFTKQQWLEYLSIADEILIPKKVSRYAAPVPSRYESSAATDDDDDHPISREATVTTNDKKRHCQVCNVKFTFDFINKENVCIFCTAKLEIAKAQRVAAPIPVRATVPQSGQHEVQSLPERPANSKPYFSILDLSTSSVTQPKDEAGDPRISREASGPLAISAGTEAPYQFVATSAVCSKCQTLFDPVVYPDGCPQCARCLTIEKNIIKPASPREPLRQPSVTATGHREENAPHITVPTKLRCKICNIDFALGYIDSENICKYCAAKLEAEKTSKVTAQTAPPDSFADRMKALHKISSSDMCSAEQCEKNADLRLGGKPYCLAHFYNAKSVMEARNPSTKSSLNSSAEWPFPTGSRP